MRNTLGMFGYTIDLGDVPDEPKKRKKRKGAKALSAPRKHKMMLSPNEGGTTAVKTK